MEAAHQLEGDGRGGKRKEKRTERLAATEEGTRMMSAGLPNYPNYVCFFFSLL